MFFRWLLTGLFILSPLYLFAWSGTGEPALIQIQLIGNQGSSLVIYTGSTPWESEISILSGEIITVSGSYINCNASDIPMFDESPEIRWFHITEWLIWTGNNINISTSLWSYYATFYCKGTSFNSIGFWISTAETPDIEPVVSAGFDSSYNPGDIVNLSGNIIWQHSSCTTFLAKWEQVSGTTIELSHTGEIFMSSSSFTGVSFTYPSSKEPIVMRLRVSPQSCAQWWNTYSGTITYSKIVVPQVSWWWGWVSSATLMQETKTLFADTGSIAKISLRLNIVNNSSLSSIILYWNSIGGDGYTYYQLEYSTGSTFEPKQTRRYETTSTLYDIPRNFLDANSSVHYFRVRAGYLDAVSAYSPVLVHYTEDYLPIVCHGCKKLPTFSDIWDTFDVWMYDIFHTKCPSCKRNSNFFLSF